MIIDMGIDVIDIVRFSKIPGRRFMNRVFTTNEQEYLLNKHESIIAGIFAAKEAVVKALGTGFQGFWPRDIEIVHDEFGKPYALLQGKPADIAKDRVHLYSDRVCMHKPYLRYQNGYYIQICISHSEEIAVATAIFSLVKSK